MIDIHCHIVPNIDDGAKSLNDALEMAKIAYDEGIRKIVNTSHYHPNFEYKKGKELFEMIIDDNVQLQNEIGNLLMINGYSVLKVKEFNNILKLNNLDIEVLIGNELYYSEDIIEIIEQKEFYTLNNSKYLLIEFPPIRFPKNIVDIIYEIKIRGFVPILAHVERYKEVQENNNMIHFIATDAHSSTRRRPIIRETYDYIVRKYGEQKAEILFIQNPYKVIEDKEISIESPRKYEKSKGFFKKLFKK